MGQRTTGRIWRLKHHRRKLARGIKVPEKLLRGSLTQRRIECGKPGCRCHTTGGHGPYIYLSQTQKQQHTSTLVPGELKNEVRTYLSSYRRVRRQLYRLSHINTELLKLGGLKSGVHTNPARRGIAGAPHGRKCQR